jgi:hypothetical protein
MEQSGEEDERYMILWDIFNPKIGTNISNINHENSTTVGRNISHRSTTTSARRRGYLQWNTVDLFGFSFMVPEYQVTTAAEHTGCNSCGI